MWLFGSDRRREERLTVGWMGALRCTFPDLEETLQAAVVNASRGGALLNIDRLQIGAHHLVISDETPRLELEIAFSGGPFKTEVEIRWYDQIEEDRNFAVGVQFKALSKESLALLKEALKNPD
jgi:hypothetical protein